MKGNIPCERKVGQYRTMGKKINVFVVLPVLRATPQEAICTLMVSACVAVMCNKNYIYGKTISRP